MILYPLNKCLKKSLSTYYRVHGIVFMQCERSQNAKRKKCKSDGRLPPPRVALHKAVTCMQFAYDSCTMYDVFICKRHCPRVDLLRAVARTTMYDYYVHRSVCFPLHRQSAKAYLSFAPTLPPRKCTPAIHFSSADAWLSTALWRLPVASRPGNLRDNLSTAEKASLYLLISWTFLGLMYGGGEVCSKKYTSFKMFT